MAYNDDGSEGGLKGTFEIYRAEGESLFKNGEYKKAIESYTNALELRNNDKDCLVARSKCHLMLGDNDASFKDAETSLADNPNYHKGIYQKAEALYAKGEFEWSLMFYHRGHKLRPELQDFRLGIQKAQEAIDNAVGSPESVKLTKDGDLTYFEQQANDSKPMAKGGKGGQYNRPGSRDGRKKNKEPPKSAAKDKTIKQLLGEMYGDRIYLEMLLKETDRKSGSGQTVYDLAHDGISYLDNRTEFWRQQKPMYARKRDRVQRRGSKDNKKSPNEFVVKELEKIDEEQAEGKFEESLKRAKKCLRAIENYSDDTINNRAEVVATLHSNIGNAYLELNNLNKAQEAHQKDYEIGEEHDLEECKSRALDNLGRVYARKGEYDKAIGSWGRKIPLAKTPLETTWLYHEIGRCHLEMGNYEEARNYGEKSVTAANESGDEMWQLNAKVLLAQSEVKLCEYQAALGSFESALDMAKAQRDTAAEGAIKKAIDDVNKKIVQELKKEEQKGDEGNEESQETEDTPKEDSPREQTEQKEPETQVAETKDNSDSEEKTENVESKNEDDNKDKVDDGQIEETEEVKE